MSQMRILLSTHKSFGPMHARTRSCIILVLANALSTCFGGLVDKTGPSTPGLNRFTGAYYARPMTHYLSLRRMCRLFLEPPMERELGKACRDILKHHFLWSKIPVTSLIQGKRSNNRLPCRINGKGT